MAAKYNRIEIFTNVKEILKTLNDCGEETLQLENGYVVKANSLRYETFNKSLVCAECGITGSYLALEKHNSSKSYHFNLYGISPDGKEILMTKNLVIPRIDGGKDYVDNTITLCECCSEIKDRKRTKEINMNKKEKKLEKLNVVIEEKPKEEFKTSNYLIGRIKGILDELDELDEYLVSLPKLQQEIDYQISDILHFIEKEKITARQKTKLYDLLKEKRLIRKAINQDFAIKNVYIANKNKISFSEQRCFLLSELFKKEKTLDMPYGWRDIDVEQIRKIIGGK